jgi:hypothetical protein
MRFLAFLALHLSFFFVKCAGQTCPSNSFPCADWGCCPNGYTCGPSNCTKHATPLDKEWWLWLVVSIVLAIIAGAVRRSCRRDTDRQQVAASERQGLLRAAERQSNTNTVRQPNNASTAQAWFPPTIPGPPEYSAPPPSAPPVEAPPLPVFSSPASAPPPTAGPGPFSKLYQEKTG